MDERNTTVMTCCPSTETTTVSGRDNWVTGTEADEGTYWYTETDGGMDPGVMYGNTETDGGMDPGVMYGASGTTADILRYILVTVGLVGVISNGFVILVMLKFRKMLKTIGNIYLLHQSVVDGLGSLFLFLYFILYYEMTGKSYSGLADEVLCRVWVTGLPMWTMSSLSIINLIVVTLERFMAITRSLWHKVTFTPEVAAATLSFIWMFGIVVDSVIVILTSKVIQGQCVPSGVWASNELRRLSGIYYFSLTFALPLIIFTSCYIKMAQAVGKKVGSTPFPVPPTEHAQIASLPVPPVEHAQTTARKRRQNRNLLKTLGIVCMTYIICWTMTSFLYLLGSFDALSLDIETQYLLTYISSLLSFCNFVINPFIYAAKYKQFQQSVKRLCMKCKTECKL